MAGDVKVRLPPSGPGTAAFVCNLRTPASGMAKAVSGVFRFGCRPGLETEPAVGVATGLHALSLTAGMNNESET